MCGIFGFSRLTSLTKNMAPWLAWDMANRGTDAWGATNGVEIYKSLGSIIYGWRDWDKWERWKQGIWHTRAASVGKGDEIVNAHPFIVEKQTGKLIGAEEVGKGYCELEGVAPKDTIIGIHNGGISNWTELEKKYTDRKGFLVDSIHIFAQLAQGFPMSELNGYGAVAWYNEGRLNLVKFNGGDLHVVRMKSGEVVFCSVLASIHDAAAMCNGEVEQEYDVNTEVQYEVVRDYEQRGVDELCEIGQMRFGGRVWTTRTYNVGAEDHWNGFVYTGGRGYQTGGGNTNHGYPSGSYSAINDPCCKICREVKKDNEGKHRIICEECFKRIEDEYIKDTIMERVEYVFD